jgi:uncharacterized protein YjbI with pentapeptide repeats
VAGSQQRWRILRRWPDHSPGWLPRTAALAGMAVLTGVVWWRWGLAELAVAFGIAVVGGLLVWAGVMPSRLAPPVPTETLNEISDPRGRLEVADARTRLRHDLRNGALQLLTVLAVLVGAGLGFQQLAEDRDQASQDRQLTRQGQASERFTRAIDQLGSRRVETRIGGIYGLHQIAEQAPENTGPVGEVLLAWLNGRPRPRIPPDTPLREYAPDVQAALTVLTGQRRYASIVRRLDLEQQGLLGADLTRANLSVANLTRANLSVADLADADLSFAQLNGADLTYARLSKARLEGALLTGANLTGTSLRNTDLSNSNLFRANLTNANLHGANLSNAYLTEANLSGADLAGANLASADLKSARLRGAEADGSTRFPPGFDWRSAGVRLVP